MRRSACFIGLAAVLALPAAVHALATEHLGNKPIAGGWGFSAELLDAVNVEERVYWREVNGNPTFYFKGSPKAVNDAIRRFAKIPAEKREIILVAGPGLTHTFGRHPVQYTWALHDPHGRRFDGDSDVADTRATLTIHITALLPPPLNDTVPVKKWIGELNSDDFKTRERAARDLTALGRAAAPVLKQALKETKAVEARERLERVLASVSGELGLDVLELPADMPVVGVDDLLKRARKELSNETPRVRAYAASSLGHQGIAAEEIVPDFEKVLKSEKDEYALRCALSGAAQLGTAAKSLLPIMREHLKSDDKNVVHMAQSCIELIERAKPEAVSEAEVKSRAAIRKEIREFVVRRAAK